jgi:TonB family protein
MFSIYRSFTNDRANRGMVKLMQVAAIALAVTLTVPAHAADQRGIQSRTAAVYPELAKRMRIAGAVSVQATVEPDGRVKEAKAIAGNHLLSPAAEEAVRHWKFEPAASQSVVDVQVNFALAD